MTAAEYALILDQERKVEGWWLKVCPNCGISAHIGFNYGLKYQLAACKKCGHFLGQPIPFDHLVASVEDYIGPDDLHTARSEAWRGEEWLVQKSDDNTRYRVCITKTGTDVQIRRKFCDFENIYSNKDHAAAIAEAVRRVNDGQK